MLRVTTTFIVLLLLIVTGCSEDTSSSIETYTVESGRLIISVTETGELEAVNSRTITAPMISWNLGGLKISKIVDDGKQVEEGEVVVEFDKTEVQKNLDDAKANLEIALAELRKAQASQQSEIEELQANYKKSQMQYKISELELQKAIYEAEIDKKNKELDLEKAGISLEKASEEIDNKKKVHHEELSKLQLKVNQEKSKVEEAEATLAKLTVSTPDPGIAILRKNRSTGNKMQVNDEVWRGYPIIGIPDLSLMQAMIPVNEVDIAKLDTALSAYIRLDAFPDTSFQGMVRDIAALARNKERDSKVKVFDVTVVLSETDETLMPGMTVSCEIVIDELRDVLFIPLDAVFHKDNEVVTYVKNGSSFKPTAIKTGAENDDYVVVTEGLEEGDEVAMIDPAQLSSLAGSQAKAGE